MTTQEDEWITVFLFFFSFFSFILRLCFFPQLKENKIASIKMVWVASWISIGPVRKMIAWLETFLGLLPSGLGHNGLFFILPGFP